MVDTLAVDSLKEFEDKAVNSGPIFLTTYKEHMRDLMRLDSNEALRAEEHMRDLMRLDSNEAPRAVPARDELRIGEHAPTYGEAVVERTESGYRVTGLEPARLMQSAWGEDAGVTCDSVRLPLDFAENPQHGGVIPIPDPVDAVIDADGTVATENRDGSLRAWYDLDSDTGIVEFSGDGMFVVHAKMSDLQYEAMLREAAQRGSGVEWVESDHGDGNGRVCLKGDALARHMVPNLPELERELYIPFDRVLERDGSEALSFDKQEWVDDIIDRRLFSNLAAVAGRDDDDLYRRVGRTIVAPDLDDSDDVYEPEFF